MKIGREHIGKRVLVEELPRGCHIYPFEARVVEISPLGYIKVRWGKLIETWSTPGKYELLEVLEDSGMYVNCVYCCVYCGHRCGPGETTPVSMADALKMHIEECPKHPMSALKSEVARLRTRDEAAVEIVAGVDEIMVAIRAMTDGAIVDPSSWIKRWKVLRGRFEEAGR